MDDRRFDWLTRSLARSQPRRRLLAGFAGAAGLAFPMARRQRLAAQTTCGEGLTDCGGVCVDLTSSAFHCGACGVTCDGTICVNGACTGCDAGLTACYDFPDSACVDLANDPTNCGACGRICASGACAAGACAGDGTGTGCAGGLTDCGGVCVDLATDPSNCGGCGVGCYAGATCADGLCQGACPEGRTDCGGFCVDLANDPTNCGACGNVCGEGTLCLAGSCLAPTAAATETPVPPTTEPTATVPVVEEPTSTPAVEATAVPAEPTATIPAPTEPVATVAGADADATAAPTRAARRERTPTAIPQQAGSVSDATAPCPATTEDENETLARGWYDALSRGDLDALAALLAADVVHHAATFPDGQNRDDLLATLDALLTGFPDVRYRVDQAITEDDLVVLRWTATGTHEGEFQNLSPTGREATWTGINIFRIECGRIAEVWSEVDGIGRLRQLGVLREPTPEA